MKEKRGPMSIEEELQEAALAMIAAAEKGRSVVATLRARCPYVYRQLRQDARHPGLLSLWGRCVNFDDNARQVIVHPAILGALGELAEVPMRGRVIHAGLQHTYGYLFSLIQTPFGFKRDRWVSTDLERGLGIDLTLLGGRPVAGTLLANATWLLGQVAFRGRPAQLAQLERQADAVAPALVAYDYPRLHVCAIRERVVLPGQARRTVSLLMDLVTLPHAARGDHLLIYSTQAGARAPLRLVTAFPVSPDTVDDLRTSAEPGRAAKIRLRYNAYVPGLYGRTVSGRRMLVRAP
jgi:hypothetical protein